MELRQIRYVLEIAKYHSFSRAAEMLFISQPAISQQVRALEQELHTTLFQRDTHGVALTRDGERFCAAGEQILEQADRLRSSFGAEPQRQQRLNLGVFVLCRRYGLSADGRLHEHARLRSDAGLGRAEPGLSPHDRRYRRYASV